jgi:cobalt/nickel transport system permease protein
MDLDRYIPRASPVHRYDARLKLVLGVAGILGIALLPSGSLVALGVTLAVLVVLSIAADLGPWRLVRGSWVALPFAIVALPLAFTRPGEALVTLDLGPLAVTVTREGLRDVVTIVLKSWLSVQVALLLAYSTPFPALIDALRSLRLPAIIVSIVSFMYRYLAVIGDEAGRMNRAKAARSAAGATGSTSVLWRAKVTGSMVGSLFIRSYERSERVYAAMLARGYDRDVRAPGIPPPDRAATVACLTGLVSMAAFVAAVHAALPRW